MVELSPDIETIVCNYLRVHDAIVALGARIVQKPPPKKTTPWVEVTKLDTLDDPNVAREHLFNWHMQFDCYAGAGRDPDGEGGGPPEAMLLARTTRAVLKELEGNVQGGAYISFVRLLGGPRFPDEANDREVLRAVIYGRSDA